jgi:hypothetical protein
VSDERELFEPGLVGGVDDGCTQSSSVTAVISPGRLPRPGRSTATTGASTCVSIESQHADVLSPPCTSTAPPTLTANHPNPSVLPATDVGSALTFRLSIRPRRLLASSNRLLGSRDKGSRNLKSQLSFHCALLDPRTTSTGSFQ